MTHGLLELKEYRPLLDEILQSGGVLRIYPRGVSMLPFLREGRDSVDLGKAESIIPGDIVLYTTKTGKYLLHRVLRVKDGNLDICGDNQCLADRMVGAEQVAAKVVCVYRDDIRFDPKTPSYVAYVDGIIRHPVLHSLKIFLMHRIGLTAKMN